MRHGTGRGEHGHYGRLARFRDAHPNIAVLSKLRPPKAFNGSKVVATGRDLGDLLDQLEEEFPAPQEAPVSTADPDDITPEEFAAIKEAAANGDEESQSVLDDEQAHEIFPPRAHEAT